jgi:hypothetical protein
MLSGNFLKKRQPMKFRPDVTATELNIAEFVTCMLLRCSKDNDSLRFCGLGEFLPPSRQTRHLQQDLIEIRNKQVEIMTFSS